MTDSLPSAFFAYPSHPPSVGDVIRTAVKEINNTHVAHIVTWEEFKIGGKFVINEICKIIEESSFFCADLTAVNPNVMFELGYAIGKKKRIWITLDSTFGTTKADFEQLRILTTIGYRDCCNSNTVRDRFLADQPYSDLTDTVFKQAIEPSLEPGKEPSILYLKSRHEVEASIQLTKSIQAIPMPVTVDDPHETPIQNLSWYGEKVYSSEAVICHFSGPEREGSRLHNARQALVAGMAYGMGKRLLMLAEGDFLGPIDYRDFLRQYKLARDAVKYFQEWWEPIGREWQDREKVHREYKDNIRLATELKGLYLGEPVAESESERLVQEYFIETTAYAEALDGRQTLFVGRKGSGKSANLIKLQSSLSEDARNLVCVIKPVGYELQGIVRLLGRYREIDAKSYAIESLWKFLIFTEIAITAARQIQLRPAGPSSPHENELLELLESDDKWLMADFTIRLERCVERLSHMGSDVGNSQSIQQSRLAISESLHEGILRELRRLLGKVLADKKRVAILIDNLDKTWGSQGDVGDLARFILGLLSVADRISSEFGRGDNRRDPVNVSLAIFLRSDIFDVVLKVAEEPDKIPASRLTWSDGELLLRVIEERFIASHGGSAFPEEMWKRYFCDTARDLPIKQYLTGRVLPRPRDLVVFVKAAITTAVNRRHTKVEEEDLLEAERQYAQHAFESVKVELADEGITSDQCERILYEFIGGEALLSAVEVGVYLEQAGVTSGDVTRMIDRLCALSFLGVEVKDGDFRFAEDARELKRNVVLARKLGQGRGTGARYKINRSFWPFLEIRE